MFDFDVEFIDRLKKKDKAAFNEFYLKTVDIFFSYIQANFNIDRSDSYDLISDFYVKFWENIHRYKEKKQFSAYIRTLFRNLIKDYFRKNKDLSFTDLSKDYETFDFEDSLMSDDSILDLLEQNFEIDTIKSAIQNLNLIEQEIVHLKFVHENSYTEISEMLDLSEENIRQKLSRAIKKIKKLLGE